jgi:predicted enzyme related to lactoylglutathione lyase
MKILQSAFRLYVSPESFERTIAFYERFQNQPCERRMHIAETGIDAAKVGGFLIFAGSPETLAPVRHVDAIFYVDSLDECLGWLPENGAEILAGPRTVTAGRNATVRNPDGLVVEVFEAVPAAAP